MRLFHTHGKADRTVPLEGRKILPGFVQGNVLDAMQIWRAANDCPLPNPDGTQSLVTSTLQDWTRCAPDTSRSFDQHGLGHSKPKGWAQMAVGWFEAPR